MSTNESIQSLLDKKIDAAGLVYDGIVCEEQFGGILYLLKDAAAMQSGKPKAEQSFLEEAKTRAECQKDQEPRFWPSLCYWTEAFKNPDAAYSDSLNCGGNLLEVAVVNLRKTAGKGDEKDLAAAVDAYGPVIRKELTLIKPKLVLCGGVFDYAKQVYNAKSVKTLACGAEYFTSKHGTQKCVVVKFINPAVRVSPPATFAYAKAIAQELREKGLL